MLTLKEVTFVPTTPSNSCGENLSEEISRKISSTVGFLQRDRIMHTVSDKKSWPNFFVREKTVGEIEAPRRVVEPYENWDKESEKKNVRRISKQDLR